MGLFRCTIDGAGSGRPAPVLSHAVMGNMGANLRITGVRLQRTLEAICPQPLLRRTMGTFNTGIGIDATTGVYRLASDGSVSYDFTFMDQILDVMVNERSIPFFGIGFMPDELSSAWTPPQSANTDSTLPPEAGVQPVRKLEEPWMKINRFPPGDYQRWYDLVFAVVRHLIERYGESSVRHWFWDFWNEPDLRYYWLGTPEEFFKTYDYAAAAVRAALPGARIGGCGPAGQGKPMFRQFLEHCTSGQNFYTGGKGAPLDFITFHMKGGPSGSKGNFPRPYEATDYHQDPPSLDHIIEQTRIALRTIAEVPGTEGLPCYLTECDIDWGTGTSIYRNPNMRYRNSEYFPVFECALTRRMLDLREEFPANPIEATFLDTFQIPGMRLFEGQRTLVTAEVVDKPILNGLRLLGKLCGMRLRVREEGPEGMTVTATRREDGTVAVMAVNYLPALDYGESHTVKINVEGLPAGRWKVTHWRIDRDHSNAHTVWEDMGRPVVPDEKQLAAIQTRMGLERMGPRRTVETTEGVVRLRTTLTGHAVSLWELERVR